MKIKLLLAFLFCCFCGYSQVNLKSELVTLFDSNSEKNVACYRIPAITTAPNGDLLVAVDERVPNCGDLRGNDDINIVLRRSKDNGKTWGDIESVVNFPKGESASDPSFIVDKETNTIFLFYNYMDLVNAHNIYKLHFIKSTDNGKSWSPAVDFTASITKPEWQKDFQFITSGRGMQTKNGELYHTLVNLQRGLYVFGSKDHGKTWFLVDTAIKPADESKIIELPDGSWMINSRVKDKGMRVVHTSSDKGKTWKTRDEPSLQDPACNASLISIGRKKQQLVFSNAYDKSQRVNLSVCVSNNQGKTWSTPTTIFSGSSAYSSMAPLNKRKQVGLVFEKDDYTIISFIRLKIKK